MDRLEKCFNCMAAVVVRWQIDPSAGKVWVDSRGARGCESHPSPYVGAFKY